MFTTEWKFGLAEFEEVRALREEVLVQELGLPQEAVFDWEDGIAAHLLVRLADGTAVAAARIYPKDGETFLGEFAVKKEFRGRGYGDVCLRLLLFKAQQLAGERVRVNVPKRYLPYYAKFGILPLAEADGEVIPCAIAREAIFFPSECGGHH